MPDTLGAKMPAKKTKRNNETAENQPKQTNKTNMQGQDRIHPSHSDASFLKRQYAES
jgi:hypothetical protein